MAHFPIKCSSSTVNYYIVMIALLLLQSGKSFLIHQNQLQLSRFTRSNVYSILLTRMNMASITDSTRSIEITLKNGYQIVSKEFNEPEIEFETDSNKSLLDKNRKLIKLKDVAYGWGNGAHPTTKLCLDFIIDHVKSGNNVLDYGTGSGILSIMAAKLGATRCIGVDIDEDTILAAQYNVALNNVQDVVEIVHTKEVYVGEDKFPVCDITVANILPGPLSRLVAAIWSFTKPGGLLCISGLRPEELPSIQTIYSPFVDLATSSVQTESHAIYGTWVSWVVRMKMMNEEELSKTRNLLTELTLS